ncbi:MAG: IucA/IucC family C-terminal-domain containing protein [Acidimicrobiia bacterium]
MSAADVVERVTATVGHLRVTVGADGGADWIPSEPLVDDPDRLIELVRATAADRGTDRDDVATSLFVQGYAFRIASVAIGAWLLDDVVLDVRPARTAIALGRARPNAVRLDDAVLVETGLVDGDALAALHDVLVDDHLARLVATAHDACRIGEALLWSNVGAGCASSFGAFMGPLEDRRPEIRDRFQAFLAAARPELRRSGRIAPVGPLWAWERSACCLWYTTESGFRCEDCSLWTADERQARYDRVLAELGS